MATNKRTYPNDYFAWYNDDDRLAILCEDRTTTSGEKTKEKYDTYQDSTISNGIRLTYHSKYETATAATEDLKSDLGLDTGLHKYVLDYIKCRIYENMGNLQQAQYHMNIYTTGIKKWPHKKSGVRFLSVPRL
jgi:hypothetical protein|tara:strand:+ start:676 stop:1074 length:399 start_codon:yes stop_codon:yes gene_type:complete